MEGLVLTGIASRPGQAKLIVRQLPAGPKAPTRLLSRLAEAGVSVDLVSTVGDGEHRSRFELTMAEDAIEQASAVCGEVLREFGVDHPVEAVTGLSRIALVGSGMHDLPGVYARTYAALLDVDVEVQAVSSSSISITLLVDAEREEAALRALHRAFELELGGASPPGRVSGEPVAGA